MHRRRQRPVAPAAPAAADAAAVTAASKPTEHRRDDGSNACVEASGCSVPSASPSLCVSDNELRAGPTAAAAAAAPQQELPALPSSSLSRRRRCRLIFAVVIAVGAYLCWIHIPNIFDSIETNMENDDSQEALAVVPGGETKLVQRHVAIAVLFTSPLVRTPLKAKLTLGKRKRNQPSSNEMAALAGQQEKISWVHQNLSPDTIDAAAVLLRSVEAVRNKNSPPTGGSAGGAAAGHNVTYDYLALVTPDVDDKWIRVIQQLGYTTRRVAVPIEAKDIRNPDLVATINQDGRLGANEMAKIEPFLFNEYDRVLMVDSDVLFHRNFDELFVGDDTDNDNNNSNNVALQWTAGGILSEPMNGGFLVINPKARDAARHHDAILDILREGDYDPRTGWKNSGVGGGTYGGLTVQGLLPYYFLHALNGTASREIDRCRYNNMQQVQRCKDYAVEEVTSNHFTGDCTKPWQCIAAGRGRGLKFIPKGQESSVHPMCTRFQKVWWERWTDLAHSVGAPTERCGTGTFVSKHLYDRL